MKGKAALYRQVRDKLDHKSERSSMSSAQSESTLSSALMQSTKGKPLNEMGIRGPLKWILTRVVSAVVSRMLPEEMVRSASSLLEHDFQKDSSFGRLLEYMPGVRSYSNSSSPSFHASFAS
jgi:hypothetical protein